MIGTLHLGGFIPLCKPMMPLEHSRLVLARGVPSKRVCCSTSRIGGYCVAKSSTPPKHIQIHKHTDTNTTSSQEELSFAFETLKQNTKQNKILRRMSQNTLAEACGAKEAQFALGGPCDPDQTINYVGTGLDDSENNENTKNIDKSRFIDTKTQKDILEVIHKFEDDTVLVDSALAMQTPPRTFNGKGCNVMSASHTRLTQGSPRTFNGKGPESAPSSTSWQRANNIRRPPAINGYGVAGILDASLAYRLHSAKSVSLYMRATIGKSRNGEKPIERFAYILDTCPHGNVGCNRPIQDATVFVALCKDCWASLAVSKPLMKCVVDHYIADEVLPQIGGMFSPEVSISEESIAGLTSLVSMLTNGMRSVKVDVRHGIDHAALRSLLSDINVRHSIDTSGFSEQMSRGIDITAEQFRRSFIKNPLENTVKELGVHNLFYGKNSEVYLSVILLIAYLWCAYKAGQPDCESSGYSIAMIAIGCYVGIKYDAISLFANLFNKNRSDEVGPQMDAPGLLAKGVLGMMYHNVFRGMGAEFSMEDFVKRTSSFKKYKEGMDFTFDFVLEMVQDGLTAACELFKVEEIRVKADPDPDLTAWLKEVRDLMEKYERSSNLDFSLLSRVLELKKTGAILRSKFEKRKDKDRALRIVENTLHDLTKIFARLQRFGVVASGPRQEPLGILVCGNTGVGKTTSSHDMMLAVTARILTNEEDEERFMVNHCDFIYNRVSEEEYFTGYHGQEIFYFDDIGATVDVAGQLNSPYMEAIRAINSNNYILHMAALEDKGTTPFTSKIVWATTMREQFVKDLDSLWRDGSAFIRRWSPYWAAPRENCSTPETAGLGPKARMVDPAHIDPSDPGYSYLEFYEYDIRTGKISGSPMSYADTIDNIVAKYERKYAYGGQLLDRNEYTKVKAIVTKRLKRKELEECLPQGDHGETFDERVKTETDRIIRERVKKDRDQSKPVPVLTDSSKAWLQRSVSSMWPEKPQEDVDKMVDEKLEEFKSLFDPNDLSSSRDRFEASFAQYVFEINEKRERERVSKPALKRLQEYTSAWYEEHSSTAKKIGIAVATLAGVTGLVALGRAYWKQTGDDPPRAQSYTQRVARPKPVRVKQLKPRKAPVYGKGHVQRVGGRDYSVIEQIQADILESHPQIGMDKSTQDILTKVFMRAQYKVSCVGHSSGYGYLTMLDGRIGVLPMHFWVTWSEMMAQRDPGDKLMLTFARYHSPDATREVAFDEIESYSPEDMMERDLVFVVMPETFPRGPNIRKHILHDSEVPKDKFIGAVYLERENCIQVPIVTMHYKQGFGYTDYVLPDSFEYPIPTRMGDCGSWVAVCDPTTGARKLLGIHVAGRQGSAHGIGVHISAEEVNAVCDEILTDIGEVPMSEDWEPQSGEVDQVEPSGRFNTLEMAEALHAPNVTKIVESPLAQDLPGSGVKPALLRKITGPKGIVDPWTNARSKYELPVKYLDKHVLRACTSHYVSDVIKVSVDMPGLAVAKKVYTFEQAVAGLPGVPNFDGISRSTSPGYPWCLRIPKGYRHKTHFFGEEGDYEFTSTYCHELKTRVDVVVTSAKEGRRLKHIYADFLKDERRPIDKVETGKTRLVSGCPLDYLIAVRMYFGDFTRWYLTNNIRNGSAIGCNCFGPDWTRIVKHLRASSGVRNLIAGDFKSYDGSLSRAVQNEFLELVELYYSRLDNPDAEKDTLVRRVLFEDIVNSKHIVDSSVYEWTSSMPSGNPLTTVLNTFCNNILIRYASLLAYSLSLGSKWNYPVLSTQQQESFLTIMDTEMSIIAYGDDNVIAVGEELKHVIDQSTLTVAFEKMGFTYLDETKGDAQHTWRSLGEVSFLKRAFSKVSCEDAYVAPLELSVVLESPRWTKRSDKNDAIVRDNVDNCLRELSLHPKKVWDKHAPKILCAAKDRIGYVPVITDYDRNRELARATDIVL